MPHRNDTTISSRFEEEINIFMSWQLRRSVLPKLAARMQN